MKVLVLLYKKKLISRINENIEYIKGMFHSNYKKRASHSKNPINNQTDVSLNIIGTNDDFNSKPEETSDDNILITYK